MKILAERLKKLRLAEKLTKKEVAAEIKIDRTVYVRYEKGEYQMSIQTLIALADYFNVSIDYLVGKSDYQN